MLPVYILDLCPKTVHVRLSYLTLQSLQYDRFRRSREVHVAHHADKVQVHPI